MSYEDLKKKLKKEGQVSASGNIPWLVLNLKQDGVECIGSGSTIYKA
jgi:hypothetical protein